MASQFDFDDDLFSDVRVVFVLNETVRQDGASSSLAEEREQTAPREELIFPAHRIILANCSPVLKTMLLRAEEEQAQGGAPKRKRVDVQEASSSPMELRISIDDKQQVAAEVLLRYMYSGDFSKETEQALGKACGSQQVPASLVHLLVSVYRLADRLEVKACLEECATAIVGLKSADLDSTDDINFICFLQASAPILCDKPPINGLLNMCSEVLVNKLPDAFLLCEDWNTSHEQGWELFPLLNYHALLAWVSSDLLEATSETDVLVLVCHWIKHNKPSSSQLALLSHRIRLKNLTSSYQVNLKVIAPWFAATPTELAKVLSLQGTTVDMRKAGWTVPPDWFGEQRPLSGEFSNSFGHDTSKKKVLNLFEAARGQGLDGWASEAMDLPFGLWYCNGYYFDVALDVHKLADGSGFDLVFVLRAKHAVVKTWDSQGGDKHGDEGGSNEEAEEGTVEGVSAAGNEAELESRISNLLSVPICVKVIELSTSYHYESLPVKAEMSILLPLQREWMRVGSLAEGLHDASDLWSFLDDEELLTVCLEISGVC